MAHRRGSLRGRVGISDAQRRKKAWFDLSPLPAQGEDIACGAIAPAVLVAPGQSTALLVFPSSENAALAESTLLRIRGWLEVPKTVTQASAGGTACNAFGIGIVTDSAALVTDGVPNPATSSGASWDGWMFLRSSNQSPVDITGSIVDVKAMRKWKSGDSIVFVAGLATDNAAGASGDNFQFSLRGLFLLP